MSVHSVWINEVPQPKYPALTEDIFTDVAIVGGGITGLTAALLLLRAGKKVVILDNAQVAVGETSYSTGHLTQILDTRYHKLISDFGEEKARLVATSKRDAIAQIEAWVNEYGISCGFKRVPGYLFSEDENEIQGLSQELEALRQVKIPSEMMEEAPLPFKTRHAIRVDDQAQFQPHQYVLHLVQEVVRMGGRIFENTRATHVTDGTPCQVETGNGNITASEVIIAANVPVTNWLLLNTKISAYRTYVIAAKLREPISPGLYWDTNHPYHYICSFRHEQHGDLVIVGGEDHKTGSKTDTNECFKNLEFYARKRLPIENVVCSWSGQIINPVDGLPYIGLNSFSKHVYVSTGYSGDGLTSGTLGGMIMSNLILGLKEDRAALYDATRVHPLASAGNFISENKDLPVCFIGDRFSRGSLDSPDEIERNQGKIIQVNGSKVAAYRNAEGKLHTFSPVCPHMGCYVHWNSAETSWDCPCHGSRFDALGSVLNGPAVHDLKPVDVKISMNKPEGAAVATRTIEPSVGHHETQSL